MKLGGSTDYSLHVTSPDLPPTLAELLPWAIPAVTATATGLVSLRRASRGDDDLKELQELTALYPSLPTDLRSQAENIMKGHLEALALKRSRKIDLGQLIGLTAAMVLLTLPMGLIAWWALSLPTWAQICAAVGLTVYALVLVGAGAQNVPRIYKYDSPARPLGHNQAEDQREPST